jgi:carboxyl-terminal processing protease
VGPISSSIERVQDILQQLSLDGLKGLILDLRDSPIGDPDGAANLAGLFLEKNALISTMSYRKPSDDNRRFGRGGNEKRSEDVGQRYENLPLAVLISPETSGAAEMIASALQDHKRAKMVGQRTRGKSTIQQVQSPNTTTSSTGFYFTFRITVGVFTRPSGKSLNRLPGMTASDDWGVRPDVEVVLPNQVRRQVRAWWFDHDLRQEEVRDPTRMDDTRNDPVLNAAVKLLRK